MGAAQKGTNRSGNRPVKDRSVLTDRARVSTPRTKKYIFKFGSKRRLVVTFRKFKTRQHRRSQRVRQYVIRPKFTKTREVAVTYYAGAAMRDFKRSYRPAQKQTTAFSFRLAAPPVLLMSAGITGIIYFGLNVLNPDTVNLSPAHSSAATVAVDKPAAPAPPAQKQLTRSEPTRVRIAKVGIDAPVSQTGLKADGSLDVPDVFDSTFWYDKSPTPGEIGPSIIVGHVDSYKGIAVFWRLRELVPGDTIQVDRADGSTAAFKITAVKEFPQDQLPPAEVYGNIDHAGIRLITCGGTFDKATQHYSHNTVIYGELQ